MIRTISVLIGNRSLSQILERAQREAQRFGVIVTGDECHGKFTNNRDLDGNYQVRGDVFVIMMTKKPMLAPWPAVEKRIREFFS